jgi:replicative DNA helicase
MSFKGKYTPKNTTQNDATLADYVFQKLPPQALPVEEAVLGALLTDKDAFLSTIDTLYVDAFYSDAHQAIYAAMLSLYERSKPIDLLTVKEELWKSGELEKAGNAVYLSELTSRVGSAANIAYHSRIIVQKAVSRGIIKVCNNATKHAFEDTTDVFLQLDDVQQELFGISSQNIKKQAVGIGNVFYNVLKAAEIASKREDGLLGVPSGFVALDAITQGFQAGTLTILAARPSMGKTTMTLNLALNAAKTYKKPVAFFSLEMSKEDLAVKILAMETGINSKIIKSGKYADMSDYDKVINSVERMYELSLVIDDTAAISLLELRTKCRRLKEEENIELVIIDYLQLIKIAESRTIGNREQEVSAIVQGLKALARELELPFIVLSQLSRAVDSRSDKRPQLSDLRETGSIEQEADAVCFLYRPEYYQIAQDEEGFSTKGVTEFIVSKNRLGELGTVKLFFKPEISRFTDVEELPQFLPPQPTIAPAAQRSEDRIHLKPAIEEIEW